VGVDGHSLSLHSHHAIALGGLVCLAALFFDRFDPSRGGLRRSVVSQANGNGLEVLPAVAPAW